MNNPAKRLLIILKEGKSDRINGDASCLQVWKSLLEVSDNNDAQLLSKLGKTIALVGEIEDELKQTGIDDYESNLAWVPFLRQAFANQKLSDPWSGFIKNVNDHTFNYLSNCSNILDLKFSSRYKSIENVDDLVVEVNDLLAEVLASGIDESIKHYMSQKLREMQRALDEYKITGNGPIVKSVESYVGHVIINKHKILTAKDDSVVRKFGQLMNRLAILTTLTMGALQLPGEIQELFPAEPTVPMQNKLRDSLEADDAFEGGSEIA